MKIQKYPACFMPQAKGEMSVQFPGFTQQVTGKNMSEACRKAEDFLAEQMLECEVEDRKMPPVDWDRFCAETAVGVPVMLEVNLTEYQRKWNSKAIKKTLTIPEWLNELALENNLNFSKVLQEALKEKLRV